MSRLRVTLVISNYDHLASLACGDVLPEGIDLTLIRDSAAAIDRVLNDPSIDAGEVSFSRHVIGLDKGDQEFVGIPVFVYRGFRHRCFFVRRGSPLHYLEDLEGKRIGTDKWSTTGNTWSRAALRERGVHINGISWWVGSIDGEVSTRPQGPLPPYARFAPPGRTLRDMLLEGDLDGLMCPWPPKGFYETGGPIVRLIPDYRRAEQEYYRRTGLCPAHHIIRIRRDLFKHNPWVARSLYTALDRSRVLCQEERKQLAETTPWLLAEIEEVTALMGQDWWPNGVEANRKMIQAFLDEEYAQGLISRPMDLAMVFAEFQEVMKS